MVSKRRLPVSSEEQENDNSVRNNKKAKGGNRIQALSLNRKGFKAFFLARRQLSSLAQANSSSANPAVVSDSNLLSLPLAPCPTAFPRLPDPAIRVCYQEKLRDGNGADTRMDGQGHCDESCFDVGGDRKTGKDAHPASVVKFQPFVTIVEVPSHDDYDRDTRKKIWTPKRSIRKEGRRNRLEWLADGSDWQNCKEEDEMVELQDGELMHPHTYETTRGLATNGRLTDSPTTVVDHAIDATAKIEPKMLMWKPI